MRNISKVLLPYSHHQATKEMKTDKEAIKELKDMMKDLSLQPQTKEILF